MNSYVLQRTCTIISMLLLVFFLLAFTRGQIGTEQGYYSLTVEFITSPVKVGRNTMKLIINDRKSRKPVEKELEIEVVPWMPTHEHAGSEIPIIKSSGRGEYVIERIDFSMPGDWEVYVKIINGRKEDTAVFNVNVVQ